MVINTRDTNCSIRGMVISTHSPNYFIGGMVFNTKDNNNSDEITSVGVVSVLSANYHPFDGIIGIE